MHRLRGCALASRSFFKHTFGGCCYTHYQHPSFVYIFKSHVFLCFPKFNPKWLLLQHSEREITQRRHVYRCIKSQKPPPSTIRWSTSAVITRPTSHIVCTTCCSLTRIWFSPISTYYSRTPWPSPASIWHGIAVRSTSSNSPTICLHQWTIELISTRQFTLSVHLNEPQWITSICAWSFLVFWHLWNQRIAELVIVEDHRQPKPCLFWSEAAACTDRVTVRAHTHCARGRCLERALRKMFLKIDNRSDKRK